MITRYLRSLRRGNRQVHTQSEDDVDPIQQQHQRQSRPDSTGPPKITLEVPAGKIILPDEFPSRPQPSVNDQRSSPLFCRLPPELRNRVFYFALLEHDNLAKPVPFHSYGYRPSYQFIQTISGISLLRTCRLIYLETHLMPVMTATFRDFRCWNRRAPRPSSSRFIFENRMTIRQRAAVRTLHITAQQCYLEGLSWAQNSLPVGEGIFGVRPRKVIITVRYHDWWGWESGQSLSMREPKYGDRWKSEFRRFGDALEEVVMELEMTEERKPELEEVVRHVMGWRIELDEGKVLLANEDEVKRETWEGSKHFGNLTRPDFQKQKYYVVTVRWTILCEM